MDGQESGDSRGRLLEQQPQENQTGPQQLGRQRSLRHTSDTVARRGTPPSTDSPQMLRRQESALSMGRLPRQESARSVRSVLTGEMPTDEFKATQKHPRSRKMSHSTNAPIRQSPSAHSPATLQVGTDKVPSALRKDSHPRLERGNRNVSFADAQRYSTDEETALGAMTAHRPASIGRHQEAHKAMNRVAGSPPPTTSRKLKSGFTLGPPSNASSSKTNKQALPGPSGFSLGPPSEGDESESVSTMADESYESESYMSDSFSVASMEEEEVTLHIRGDENATVGPQTIERVATELKLNEKQVKELPRVMTVTKLKKWLENLPTTEEGGPSRRVNIERIDAAGIETNTPKISQAETGGDGVELKVLGATDNGGIENENVIERIEVNREYRPHTRHPAVYHHRRHHRNRFREPHFRAEDEEGERQATWLELFFDVFFVTVMAALTHFDTIDFKDIGYFVFQYTPVWWAWLKSTLYATRFDTDDIVYRTGIFVQMIALASITISIEIHGPIAGGTANRYTFGLMLFNAVIIMNYILVYVYSVSGRKTAAWYIGAHSLAILIWGTSIIGDVEAVRITLVTFGVVLEVLVYFVIKRGRSMPFSVSYLPERFGLFTIIVLAEYIIGIFDEANDVVGLPFDLAVICVLSLIVGFSLWWIYFDDLNGAVLRENNYLPQLWLYVHWPLHMSYALLSGVTRVVIQDVAEGRTDSNVYAFFLGAAALVMVTNGLIKMVAERNNADSVYTRMLWYSRFTIAIIFLLLELVVDGFTAAKLFIMTAALMSLQVAIDLYFQYFRHMLIAYRQAEEQQRLFEQSEMEKQALLDHFHHGDHGAAGATPQLHPITPVASVGSRLTDTDAVRHRKPSMLNIAAMNDAYIATSPRGAPRGNLQRNLTTGVGLSMFSQLASQYQENAMARRDSPRHFS